MGEIETAESKPTRQKLDQPGESLVAREMQAYTLAKACDACIRAKKRCNRASPRCSRCTSRDTECVYQNEPLTAVATVPSSSQPAQAPASNPIYQLGQAMPQQNLSILVPMALGTRYVMNNTSFQNMLDELKSFPLKSALYGGNGFIHPGLYRNLEVPQPLEIMQSFLQDRVPDLQHGQHVPAEVLAPIIASILRTEPTILSFAHTLAFVQSLVTIQILTLFNPSLTPTERSEAESRQNLLLQWSYKLWQTTPSQLPSTLSPCKSYIFAESVRRALLVSCTINNLYQVVKTGSFACTLFLKALPLGANTVLWEDTCRPLSDCKREVTENPLISYRELKEKWLNGEISNPTTFERMLLEPSRGSSVLEEGQSSGGGMGSER